LFSAVISEHFSKDRMIIFVVAAKIWYLKNVRFLFGHPVHSAEHIVYVFIPKTPVFCWNGQNVFRILSALLFQFSETTQYCKIF